MGAAQQQRIDVGVADRGQQPLGEHHHLVARRLASLDELHETRARRARQRHGRAGVDHGADVGARRHRADGADDADPTRHRGLHESSCTRNDHVDDGNRQLVAELVEAGCRRRVAGDHDGLGVVVVDEAPRQFVGVAANVVERLGPVRIAARVADVDEILGRKQIDRRPGDGQPAEPGVEHPDRPIHGCPAYGSRPAPDRCRTCRQIILAASEPCRSDTARRWRQAVPERRCWRHRPWADRQ